MTVTAQQVKELRTKSGAPMMDCKKALSETSGDMEKAAEWLRKQGIQTAAKKAGRDASEGLVHSYLHHNGRVGVLVEVNCETDFVAKTDQFQAFCKEIGLHIASMSPRWLTRDEVPAELVEKEREILGEQIDKSKPADIQAKIVEGRVNKFYADKCLMEQPWVKDDSKTIEQYRAETVGTIGENIQIRRFVRFDVGDE